MGWTWIGLAGACLVLAGCAQERAKLPLFGHPAPVAAAPTGNDFKRDPHRQYFDKLRKRYYYYDPDKKVYFWENGQPKR